MNRWIRNVAALGVLGATFAAGCRDASGPVEPEVELAPRFGTSGGSVDDSVTLVEGTPPADEPRSVEAVIDRKGGELKVAGHMLVVPRFAVDQPTTFRMTVVDSGYVQVDLSATYIDKKGRLVDVGKAGFKELVSLKLSYEWAKVEDENRLLITWLKDGTLAGAKETQPSKVDSNGKYVHSHLKHFSHYVLASN